MTEKRRISVADKSNPIQNLNELEYINGRIYANIWQSNRIAIINPDNGAVEGWIDLTGLAERMKNHKKANVLNGIMYDRERNRLFVTGKLWHTLYEIRLIPSQE
jgi:glutamine cyclotransferase